MRRRLVVALGLVALVAGGALWTLLATHTGLALVWRMAADALPGTLEADALQGRLLGPVTIDGLVFRQDGIEVEVARVHLEWSPRSLLSGTFRVTRLEIERPVVHLPPPAPAAESVPPALPEIGLPVAVVVDALEVSGLTLAGTAGAPPPLDLSFAGGFSDARLEVEHLRVTGGPGRLALSGNLTAAGKYPLDLEVDGTATLEGLPEARLRLGLAGQLAGALELRGTVTGPADLGFYGTVAEPVTAPAVDLTLELRSVSTALLPPGGAVSRVSARARLTGPVDALRAEGDLSAVTRDYGTYRASTALALGPAELRIEALTVTPAQGPGTLTATGSVGLADPPLLDIQADWRDLTVPGEVSGEGVPVTSPEGRLALAGTPGDYRGEAGARLKGPGLPDLEVAVKLSGSTEAVRLSPLTLTALEGTARAEGRVVWAPRLAVDLEATVEGVNPGAQWPEWPGSLGGALGLQVEAGEDGTELSVTLEELQGQMRGYPVSAAGSARSAGGAVEVSSLEVSSGSARLTANGTVGPESDLAWTVDAPDLAALAPGLSGTLEGEGRIAGAVEAPRGRARLQGRDLEYADTRLEALDAHLTLTAEGRIDAQLTADDVAAAGQSWDRAALQVSGTLAEHRLSLALSGEGPEADVRARGGLAAPRTWSGRLEKADWSLAPWGQWQLEDPAALRIAPADVAVEPLCWRDGEGRLCTRAVRGEDGRWSGGLEASGLDLARLHPVLPPELRLTGTVAADAEFTLDPGGRSRGTARVSTTPGTVDRATEDAIPPFRFDASSLALRLDGNGLSADLEVPLPGDGGIDGRVALPGWQPAQALPPEQALDGELSFALALPPWLDRLLPQVERLRGRLDGGLTLAGTLGNPRVTGSAELLDGAAELPRLGLDLEAVTARVEQSGADRLAWRVSVQSGGTLAATGEVTLDASAGWPTTVRIQGQDVVVADLPEATLHASPDLALRYDAEALEVDGTVVIPYARLQPKGLPETAARPSGDVRRVGTEDSPDTPRDPFRTRAQVELVFGDRVSFDGFGLRARLAGRLQVLDEPGRLPTGRGELQVVDGVYRAYGQDLTIARGRFIYTGTPLDNPQLDVVAQREAGDVTAGVRVRGRLRDPRLTLFSEPDMPQSQALSYLVLGRPLNQASAEEGRRLQGAANALAVGTGNLIAREVGSRLGLDEGRLETSGEGFESASLVVGKYLSPRLYVRYLAGLFDASTVLQLRYQLTPNLEVQSETGTRSGADLFYILER